MNFNKEQLKAINHSEGNLQLISAAGSGKSTTLIARAESMVDSGIKQSDILIISFTNASAAELHQKLDSKGLSDIKVGTFHKICKEILESYGYDDLLNQPSKYNIKREIEQTLNIKNINIDDVLSWISYQKSYGISPLSQFKYKECSLGDDSVCRKAYQIYENYKKRTKTFDFDDFLILTNKLYSSGELTTTWKYEMVDEAQDSSILQYNLMKYWCPSNNICVVGDVAQSLYKFRAAEPEMFANFYNDFKNVDVVNMNTNYRSCNNIVEASNGFIRPYMEDFKYYKDAIAFNKNNGNIVCKSFDYNTDEAKYVALEIDKMLKEGYNPNDIAILYRNNAMADCIENELKKKKIDYKIYSNQSFFDRKEIKGIVSILRLVNNTQDDEAFEYVLTTLRCNPLKFYKGTLIDDLKKYSGKRDCSLYEAFIDYNFPIAWQRNNQKSFVDSIGRFKIQNDKHLSPAKMIDNIVKAFQIKGLIQENYESSTWSDKYESIENLKSFGENTNLEGFLKFIETCKPVKNQDKNCVSLMTVHRSKGLQWGTVFLIGLQKDKFPSEKSTIDEESRIMYVGITRAKTNQYVTGIGHSKFLDEYKNALSSVNKEDNNIYDVEV